MKVSILYRLPFTFKVGNGSKRLKSSLELSDNSSNNNYLGSYLAGLIEGDGSIIVPKTIRNQKGKLLYPFYFLPTLFFWNRKKLLIDNICFIVESISFLFKDR
jgi:hypothetical protein